MIMWYNAYINTRLQKINLCKVVLCSEIGQGEWLRKSLVNIPTHPPLHCNEEEIEGFGLWKEEVQTLWKFWKSALFVVYNYFGNCYSFIFKFLGDKWVASILDPHLRGRCTKFKKGFVIDIVDSHTLAWAKWTTIVIVFHKKGQSLTVLPFSYFPSLGPIYTLNSAISSSIVSLTL